MTEAGSQLWQPSEGLQLEPNAFSAIFEPGHVSVSAGPGAGKTEFLAQKAGYLLETNTCASPAQILALSFKREAANNLGERVRARLGSELSRRFASHTYDAFTKSIVDRFASLLPEDWALPNGYELTFPKPYEVREFLNALSNDSTWGAEVRSFAHATFETRIVGVVRLPGQARPPATAAEFAAFEWWKQLRSRNVPQLSFVALNRLAELLLREVVPVRTAMQATFSHVFADEFQDSTIGQYDFLDSAFSSSATFTAVGDSKQRIMGFAGVLQDALGIFDEGQSATRFPLLKNYRSSPGLVALQQVFAIQIEPSSELVQSANLSLDIENGIQRWTFPAERAQAEQIARFVERTIREEHLQPRDFAILVKQKVVDVADDLRSAFAAACPGVGVRNEARLLGTISIEDLMVDSFSRMTVELLRLGSTTAAPTSWAFMARVVAQLRGAIGGSDEDEYRVVTELGEFVDELRGSMRTLPAAHDEFSKLLDGVLRFLGAAALVAEFPDYQTEADLNSSRGAVSELLWEAVSSAQDWDEALHAYQGLNAVPIMTVHKSKGLEYDTVFFLNIDDDSWWSAAPGQLEGLSTFFVGLSRAKRRVFFTYCDGRGRNSNVSQLYDLLDSANVEEVRFER